VALSACGRAPHLAGGSIDLTGQPTTVRFHEPVVASGSTWELCFEFDLPRDSHRAAAIDAVLLSPSGARVALRQPALDRRGEATVCQIAPLPPPSSGSQPPVYEAVELRSDSPVRVRGIRGGSRP
jgi:hypothetical protein